jgi:hypothetical protein
LSWRWNCQLETSWNISYFNCLLVWCLNFPQRSRASVWQSAFFFSLFNFEISFWQIKYYQIFQKIFHFPVQFFFYLREEIVFENFSMSKNNIILVKPAHQLWYPTLSFKYYLVKEENYSHCCNWKDGVDVCATSNPGMRNWNTGIASPIGKVHTWFDLLNSDCCMHTPRLVAVSSHNLKINLSPSLSGGYFSTKDTQCKVWIYVCQSIILEGY